MLVRGKRPRELRWYHAGAILFGDWGASRLYVLGLCFFYTRHASFWFMLAMSGLLLGVGWAYQVICRLYPDGGGVYSSARHRAPILGMIGGLLLCADYVVTAALCAVDAFHYVDLPQPHLWAAGFIAGIGIFNYFGPRKSGTAALVIALLTTALTLTVAVFASPFLREARVEPPEGGPVRWWTHFTSIILAISGVEAIANMTGIMVEPVAKTSRCSIVPVMLEIVFLNLLMTLAMQAVPLDVLGDGDPSNAYLAHRDDMLRLLAHHYVGPIFAAVASFVFALLLLSSVNTAVTDLVSVQYMMSRDRELPPIFGGLNQFGMPVVPLITATLVPLTVVIAVPDVAHLADLYAIGVVGAVAVNLGTSSTNFALEMKWWERSGMMALAALMVVIWLTIAWEKPWALLFAASITAAGLTGRWVAQNRKRIREWFLAPVPTYLPAPIEAVTRPPVPRVELPMPRVEPPTPAYAPSARIMVATRANRKLIRFALEEAKNRQAELLVLFVRHLAVIPMGSAGTPDAGQDAEAQALFKYAKEAADEAGVPVQMLYALTSDVADAILDLAVTYGVDFLILGASQRGALWQTMKGDVIQQVARYLPERTCLLIHA
ncbi:MAG: amino acid transporter [Gemmataceae bacterium]